jgi:nicotinamidase/pyrazinamidase
MSALIIVDPQNDFVLTTGALSVPGAQDAVPLINLLRTQNEWDVVAVSADRHPANHGSFQTNNPGSVLYEEFVRPNGEKQVPWPDHCVKGTKGAKFVDSMMRSNNDWHVYKGQDPEVEQYSAFEGETVLPPELAQTDETSLATLLKEKGITQVTICGFATDYCVYNTALDAKKAGFETSVFLNACRGVKKETTEAAIADMRDKGIECIGTPVETKADQPVKAVQPVQAVQAVQPVQDMPALWLILIGPSLVALGGLAVAWWYKD